MEFDDSERIDKCSYSAIDKIIQQHLDLDVFIDIHNSKITGRIKITFTVLEDAPESIILDTRNLEIYSVKYLDGEELDYNLVYPSNVPEMGSSLNIQINRTFTKDDEFELIIEYSTIGGSKNMCKIPKEETSGKLYPLFYTEGVGIGARSTFPCQDTPSAKVTVKAKVTVEEPYKGLFSGIPLNKYKTESGDQIRNTQLQMNPFANYNTYEFIQKFPISTYLIVFAVGVVEYLKISDRAGVWCEPSLMDSCQEHFCDLELYIQTGEKLLTEFVWEQFNILVLPNYKYWGMENPCLTYINSAAMTHKFVIFHELCHSWTGNLITNLNWENFWINEGFTTFLERKFVNLFLGEEQFKIRSHFGYDKLCEHINSKGLTHNHTCLNPFLANQDPMESYSTVPYEKGYAFIKFLQELIGIEYFFEFLRNLIEKFKFKCLSHHDVRELYCSEVTRMLGRQEADCILRTIDWEAWIYSPGLPLKKPLFDSI